MTAPEMPQAYQTDRHTRERYDEGWQDGRAGRRHAHAEHAETIIQQQGRAQFDAYTAGYSAGRAAEQAKPGWLAWAHTVLDQLEQAQLASLDTHQHSELAARLRAMAANLEAERSPERAAEGAVSMVTLRDVIDAFMQYQQGQRQLEACRARAVGEVDYYSYSYVQDLQRLESSLETTLNHYIDQRITERQLKGG